MAISFEESKKQLAQSVMKTSAMSIASAMTLEAEPIAAAEDYNWMEPENASLYFYYNGEYSDDNISTVDENKTISLNNQQINLTQEENSQYIPFRMPRFYDGFDLSKTALSIYWVNKEGSGSEALPVDVYYNSEYLKFAWLVDKNVTMLAGKIKFEIRASGLNSKGQPYTWKTKSNDGVNVIQALEFKKFIEPDESWQTGFMAKIESSLADVRAAVNEAQGHAQDAQEAAMDASTAFEETKAIKAELQLGIDTKVESSLEEALDGAFDGYATEDFVLERINEIDVTDQLQDYALKTELPSLEGYATEDFVINAVKDADITDKLEDYALKTDVPSIDGLATETYVDEAVKSVDVTEQLADYALKSELPSVEGLATETYVDEAVKAIDITDKLGDYALKSELPSVEGLATEEYVDEKVSSVDLSEYYKKDEIYSKGEIDEKLSDVTVDLSDYYTKSEIDGKDSALSSSITTNTTNISSISKTVTDIQSVVNNIDTSPRLTYDVKYNDTEDADVGENVFAFYEITNEGTEDEKREIKQKFTIVGGGGTSTSSTLKIGYITTSPLVVTTNDSAVIHYSFSGTDSSGDAVTEALATWKVGGRVVKTETIYAGDCTFDATEYITIGTQKVNLVVTDDAGSLASKNWTVQKIDVRIESTFNDKLTYPLGTVSMDYTPYGAVSKDIHFILDGKELETVTTTASGIPMAYVLPAQEHGSHLVEAYMTATINGNTIESNHILKDIMWFDSSSDKPIIGTSQQVFTARQYEATNINLVVVDPKTETPTITLKDNGEVVSTITLNGNTHTWQYKTSEVGSHKLTVECGSTVKNIIATITELDIDIEPVTAGLVFDFDPSGRSNGDENRLWSYGAGDSKISMTVSDNFDWTNGGYQIDENGDQYFCIKAGTSANIDYKLFADDAKRNGKEFKLVFKSTNVQSSDATFLHCIDNTTDTNHIGLKMNVHEAYVYGQAGNLYLPYSEDDIIEFEFNINKDTEAVPMVIGYEDGVSTRPMVYNESHSFTQVNPKTISIGSEQCDLHIYRFKVYNTSLTARGVLNNFIADARNAEEMIDRFERNQIYDENGQLDPDILAEKCPWMRVYKLSAPYFTNNKSDKVPHTTIQQIYKDGDPILDNWTCYDASHSGQGTSSNNYGAAGRNLDFIMNKSQIEGVKPYFILGDGSRAEKITMTRTSVPVAYLNAKVNIASSNNMTNAMLANRYNQFNPYKRPFVRDEGVDTSFIKDTMNFHNCVIFIQETDEDLSTHREFNDTAFHFYAIGNIGDSKKTDETRLTDMNDKYECCVEIMDVELPLSDFPADTMYNAMGYKTDDTTGERIYTWAKDENLGILYEKIDGEYILTEDETIDFNKTYYVDILEHDDFSEDFTYGWRYIYEGDDDEENAEIFDYCKQKWIEFYRFVTTSTDEEFKAHLGDYFVVDSALYYYLFTTRYTMVDNRAKNCFLHYGKTGEVDSEGNSIRKWDLNWDYDNDTALSLNNYGAMVYRYGLEDTDRDENGEEVFREMDSTFFCRIRDLFPNELKAMFNTLESRNAWHAESFLNQIEEWQNQFPEELWRLDIERKYIRTYNSSFINGKGDPQFLTNMCNGKMKFHVKQWEREQEKYMASKYQSSLASSDNAVLRCTVPTGNLAVPTNYRLKLTPYSYMYLNVKYGTQSPIQLRAEPNKEYEIPFEGDSVDIINIYSSSNLKSLGDLSACYPATVDTSKASRLRTLDIGNATEGYDNPKLIAITLGANYLLEKLNIQNVSGFKQALNLSLLHNLTELYANGSGVTGITFAPGGMIETAYLPQSINALTMKELIYLDTFDVVSFDNLVNLTVENCDTVDVLNIINSAPNLNRIRITGVNWNIENTSVLEKLYTMSGFDSSGYNAEQSVLTGVVHVPTIREQQLHDYRDAWPDLEITFNTMIEQYAVTFVNDDGSVLEVQYVNKGENATNPVVEGRIPTPTKESTVSTDYTYVGWDSSLDAIFSPRTITAVYTGTTRTYTVKYASDGTVLYEASGLYGDYIDYGLRDAEGNIINPTYTKEEQGYTFHLFSRWDKSGYVDGNKTINAVYDVFKYNEGVFDNKELKDLSNVELYAISKLGIDNVGLKLEDGDPYTLRVGQDFNFDDVESELIVSEKTSFDGTNYIDTGISLFEKDRDFVLAIDYEFLSSTPSNSVIAQCFNYNGSRGFRLWYNNTPKFSWCDELTSNAPAAVGYREMLVLRHKAGESTIRVYMSNLGQTTDINIEELTSTKDVIIDNTLVLGCAKANDGAYEGHAVGNVHWCKVWFKDLGEENCKNLALWTHEEIDFEMCGLKRFYLSEDANKRASFSLLAKHALEKPRAYGNSSSSNTGGWAESPLNKFLNDRLYEAMPQQTKLVLKKVTVQSSIGDLSSDISSSECYITLPAVIEMSSSTTYNIEPYISEMAITSGKTISYMTSNEARKRAYDEGDYTYYWLRSPVHSYSRYVYSIDSTGYVDGYRNPTSKYGVVIEISF